MLRLDAICDPGTVMIITAGGVLDASRKAYDRRVAGVVSGASKFRPAILLDRRGDDDARPPIALAGKVYCRWILPRNRSRWAICSQPLKTVGHAMKATDRDKAFGAIIGKALAPFSQGRGLIHHSRRFAVSDEAVKHCWGQYRTFSLRRQPMAAVGFTDLPSTVHFIFEYKNELDAASAKALGKALADTCERDFSTITGWLVALSRRARLTQDQSGPRRSQ